MISESELASVIAGIYEAGVDFGRWPDALGRLAAAFGGNAAGMSREGPTPTQSWGVHFGIERSFEQAYVEHFHGINLVWRRGASAPAGTVQTDTMLVPRSDLARTEFFQDFLRPQDIGGMLNAVALVEDGRQTAVTVHSAREWDAEHVALYGLITPHLQRALEINVQLARAEINRLASESLLDRLDQGVLFVDGDAGVIFANTAAEATLMAGEGLRQADGALQGGSAAETGALRGAITACAQKGLAPGLGHSIALSRGPGRAALIVRVAPAPGDFPRWIGGRLPVAVLTVGDPERDIAPPSEDLRSRFGLTRAQAELALEMLKGDGIQAAADRMSISRATARTHLARIFEKTGTQRQAELVRALLSLRLSLRSDQAG